MRTRASCASSEPKRQAEVEDPLIHLKLDRLLARDLEGVRTRDGLRERPDDGEVDLCLRADVRARPHRDVLLDDAGGEDVEEDFGLRDGLLRVGVARAAVVAKTRRHEVREK